MSKAQKRESVKNSTTPKEEPKKAPEKTGTGATPAPAPKKETPAPAETMPKWFKDFKADFHKKMQGFGNTLGEFDKRIKAIEEMAQAKGCMPKPEEAAKAEETAKAAAEEAPVAEATEVPAKEEATKAATEEVKAEEAKAVPAVEGARAIPADWKPARAYKYWDYQSKTWGGPLLDVFAAKQAGGGTTSGYEPVWVWIDSNRRIRDLMTPAEISEFTPQ